MRRALKVAAAAAAAAVVLGGGWAVLAARDQGRPAAPSARLGGTAANRAWTVTPGQPAQGTATVAADAPSRTRLGPGMELRPSAKAIAASRRGQRLLVSGTVYAADCTTPLAGASLQVWQTNADGEYGPSQPTGRQLIRPARAVAPLPKHDADDARCNGRRPRPTPAATADLRRSASESSASRRTVPTYRSA